MTNIIYIYYLKSNISEGGMARNRAFADFFLAKKEIKSFNVYANNKITRIFHLLKFCYWAVTLTNKKVFLHQGALLYIYPVEKLFRFRIFVFFIKAMLSSLDRKNDLTIEVNDLPQEQALDLRLQVNTENYGKFETIFYSLKNAKYIFAAKHMADYSARKYIINSSRVNFIINGSPALNFIGSSSSQISEKHSGTIKYVYCGTLNKGRDIEDLVEVFKGVKHELYLIGAEGEWLIDFLEKINNVKYIGEFDESEAHKIVSKFDVGIIHYDERKLYYNICYPTKASFYITAGLPVLCTPLKEMKYHFSDLFFFFRFDSFRGAVNNIEINEIREKREKINTIKGLYLWSSLLRNIEI